VALHMDDLRGSGTQAPGEPRRVVPVLSGWVRTFSAMETCAYIRMFLHTDAPERSGYFIRSPSWFRRPYQSRLLKCHRAWGIGSQHALT